MLMNMDYRIAPESRLRRIFVGVNDGTGLIAAYLARRLLQMPKLRVQDRQPKEDAVHDSTGGMQFDNCEDGVCF